MGGTERKTWGQFEPLEDAFEYFQIETILK
jgi:hypothetical protein